MSLVSKIIRKAAVKTSIAKKAIKIAPSNVKAAFNFKSGKTIKNLMPVVHDTDSLAYYYASKANKRGLKQANRISRAALKTGVVAVGTGVTGAGAMTANNFRKSTPEQRAQTVASGKKKLADGYKYVYGKVRRVKAQ
jgi:hypothetical protein